MKGFQGKSEVNEKEQRSERTVWNLAECNCDGIAFDILIQNLYKELVKRKGKKES